jgi:hypothetical protein
MNGETQRSAGDAFGCRLPQPATRCVFSSNWDHDTVRPSSDKDHREVGPGGRRYAPPSLRAAKYPRHAYGVQAVGDMPRHQALRPAHRLPRSHLTHRTPRPRLCRHHQPRHRPQQRLQTRCRHNGEVGLMRTTQRMHGARVSAGVVHRQGIVHGHAAEVRQDTEVVDRDPAPRGV